MKVLFIMNEIGAVGDLPGISGGEVMWIEIAKCWQKKGYEIHVFTLKAGVELCRKLGLNATFHIFHVSNDFSLKSYVSRFLKSNFIPNSLRDFRGIVYSATEHVYDVRPALRIKENAKGNIWAATVHWVAPMRRKGTTWLNGILFYLNQRLGFKCIKRGADVIFAVSQNTSEQVKRIGFNKNVHTVGAGVDYLNIRKISLQAKTKLYDAVFMKRFDGTKGVFDIIDIWRDVVKVRKDAKLGMIGLGTKEVMRRLKKMVETYGIVDNVDFLGPIYDFNTKFSILASSRLFVLPSYEENWAIVIGEALTVGLPVVVYDLPEIRPIWNDYVSWIPKGNKRLFAKEVAKLLSDDEYYQKYFGRGINFMKQYDWENIAERELEFCAKLISSESP